MTLEFLLRRHLRGDPDALDMVTGDARSDGRGRDVRPARRRLPSLLDGRALARPALREDALRQRPAPAAVRARVARDAATSATGASRSRRADYLLREMQHPQGGFSSSQDADSEGVEGRFFVWSWDELVAAAQASSGPSVAGSAGRRHRVGRHPAGQLGGNERAVVPGPGHRGRAGARARSGGARTRRRGGARASSSRSARDASARRPTTRCSPHGTGWRSPRSPRPAAPSSGRSTSRPRCARPSSSSRTCGARTGGCCVRGARAAPGRPGFADDHALMAEGLPDVVRDDLRAPLVRARRARSRTSCSGCSTTPSGAASSRPARTPRRSSFGRRSSTTTPCRAGTRRPPTCCSGSPT